jgi:hypothetical protein
MLLIPGQIHLLCFCRVTLQQTSLHPFHPENLLKALCYVPYMILKGSCALPAANHLHLIAIHYLYFIIENYHLVTDTRVALAKSHTGLDDNGRLGVGFRHVGFNEGTCVLPPYYGKGPPVRILHLSDD